MSSADQSRPLIRDALSYASEHGLRLALTAVVGIFVARLLGPADLGLLSFAGGVYGILTPMVLLGLPALLVREFSTNSQWRPAMASSIAIQVPVGVVASLAGFLLVAGLRGFESDATLVALAMSPIPLFGVGQTLRSYLESAHRVRRVVLTGVAAAIVASGWRVAGLMAEAPVSFFAAAASVEALVLLLGFGWGVSGAGSPLGVRTHFEGALARRLAREGWPLLLASVAVTVYVKADLLMLGVMSGDTETGVYAAAARLSEMGYFIPMAAAAAARPRLARLFAQAGHDTYRRATQRFISGLAGTSLILVASVVLLAEQVVAVVYGAEFAAATPILRLHILAAPFVFIGVGGGQWFVDKGLTRLVMQRSVAGAGLNILLNLILIPSLGGLGAAIATLVAYASGVFLNAFHPSTRSLFRMQVAALGLRWPREPLDDHEV